MNRALEYAEKDLGVHTSYEEAKLLGEKGVSLREDLKKAIKSRRAFDDLISDREMELLIEQRGKHSDLSQAAMDRRIKEVHYRDKVLKELRSSRGVVAQEATDLELDIEANERRLKVSVARLEELAGYFNFLAALKNAEVHATRYAEAGTPATKATGGETTQQGESSDASS